MTNVTLIRIYCPLETCEKIIGRILLQNHSMKWKISVIITYVYLWKEMNKHKRKGQEGEIHCLIGLKMAMQIIAVKDIAHHYWRKEIHKGFKKIIVNSNFYQIH